MKQTIETIDRMFNARSIALVGASSDPKKFGYMTLNTIIKGGYKGEIYPVNPRGGEILGYKVYLSLKDISERPDLVMLIVPVNFVADVLREAGEKGIPGALISTGGYREAGRADLESELKTISEKYGIRIIGPNISGFNYVPNKLCLMFFPVITTFGPIGIISQSGTVTNGLSEWAEYEGLGISAAINLGNQLDLCETDFLDFLAADENTNVIIMYLEGVKDARRFLEALDRTIHQKPVVILKAGRTAVGQKSVASHTGSLAGNHEVFQAACRQLGAIVVEDLETLYDSAKSLGTMGIPAGNRVFTISTSGGANTTAMDEVDTQGLIVPLLPEEFIREVKRIELPPLASLSNPLDLVSISAEPFKKVALLVDKYDIADTILLNYGDPVEGSSEVTKDIVKQVKASVAVSYFAGGEEEEIGRLEIQKAGIPVFPTPGRAIKGIGAAVRFGNNIRSRQLRTGNEGFNLAIRKRKRYSDELQHYILEPEAVKILSQYDIPYPAHGLARSVEEAIKVADRIGYPAVLKIVSTDVLHKTDVGGVTVGIESSEALTHEYSRIIDRVRTTVPQASIEGMLVSRQAPDGLEVIVGAIDEQVFGPTVMFGLGGIFTEVLRDVTYRVAPLRREDAEDMIEEIKGYPLLRGMRGGHEANIDRIIDLLMAVSRLIMEKAEIKELDLNPVRLYQDDLVVLDVRIIEQGNPNKDDC